MSPGVRSAILSGLIFGTEVGVTAYMVGHMDIDGWSDRWLLQHPITFGVGVGLLTLLIGLLCVVAFGTSQPARRRP